MDRTMDNIFKILDTTILNIYIFFRKKQKSKMINDKKQKLESRKQGFF